MRYLATMMVVQLIGFNVGVGAAELPRLGVSCANFFAPEGSSGALFSRDCKTAYVLPPVVGSFEVKAAAKGGNTSLCSAFNASRQGLENKLNGLLARQFSAVTGQPDAKVKQCLRLLQGKKFQESTQHGFESQLNSKRDLLAGIESDLQKCSSSPGADCNGLKVQKVTYMLEAGLLESKLESARGKVQAIGAALAACGDIEANSSIAGTIGAGSADGGVADMLALNDDLFALYSKYRNLEGATLNALLTADHGKLVERARQANPNFLVQGVSTSMALVIASRGPESSIEFPATLRISIPSVQAPKEFFAEPEPGSKAVIFGPSASGNITLSLSSTCAASLDRDLAAIEVRPYFDVNAIYRFPVEVGTKIKVVANFTEIYSRIVKNTSKNGLFRSRSATEITDFTKTDEVISVVFETAEDIALADRQKIVAAIKSRVIERALALVAREYVPGIGPIAPGSAPELGATVAARAIRENCASQWCQAGSIVLDVAAAIFGSSESVASFVKEKKISESETYDLSSVIYLYRTMGFR